MNGFVLANGMTQSTKVFNQSTYAFIGSLNTTDVIGRGAFISSLNIFVFGTKTGQIGYFNVNSLPNVNISYLTPSFSSFTFVRVSPDEAYFVTSSVNSNLILFWNTSNWSLVAQMAANTAGVYDHAWSSDSRYCYSVLYN
jgi:WD40 repeat protein